MELSIRNEKEMKTFTDKRKLKEFITSRVALQECLGESCRGMKLMTLECNSEPNEEMTTSVEVNTWTVVKAGVTEQWFVTALSVFYLLQETIQ
jgi:hypothetical protein